MARALATPAAATRSTANAAAAAAGDTPEFSPPLQDSAAARLGRNATGMAALLEVSAVVAMHGCVTLQLVLALLLAKRTGPCVAAVQHAACDGL